MFSFTITSLQAIAISKFLRSQYSTKVYVEIADEVVQLSNHRTEWVGGTWVDGTWVDGTWADGPWADVVSQDEWVQVTPLDSTTNGRAHTLSTPALLKALAKVTAVRISELSSPVTIAVDDDDVATISGSHIVINDADLSTTPGKGTGVMVDIPESYSLSPADRETVWRIAQVTETVDAAISLDHGFNVNGDIATTDHYAVARGKVNLPAELADTPVFYLGLFKLLYQYRRALADVDIAYTPQGWLIFSGMVFATRTTTTSLGRFQESMAALATFGTGTRDSIVGGGVLPRTLSGMTFDEGGYMRTNVEVEPLEGYDVPRLGLSRAQLGTAFRVLNSRTVFETHHHTRYGHTTSYALMTSEGTNTGNETIRMRIMPRRG